MARRTSRRRTSRNPRCPSCGGASHPASGSALPSGEIVCGPCVRRFWSWASEHGKKTYRVGPKGKGSKYIAFPTGITKKNGQSKDITVVTQDSDDGEILIRAFRGKREVGSISAEVTDEDGPHGPLWVVQDVHVSEGQRRGGIGTTLYEAAAREARLRSGRLASERRVTPYSQGFWQKQITKGRAVTLESGYPHHWTDAKTEAGRAASDLLALRAHVRDLKNNPGRREKAVVVQGHPQFPGDLGRRFRFRGGSAVELEIQVGHRGEWVNANRYEVGDSLSDAWHPYKSTKNPRERGDCLKCSGTGYIQRFGHYAQGVCFDCGGTGTARTGGGRGPSLPPMTPASTEERIKSLVSELRTMWHNFQVHSREGEESLDEMFYSWSADEEEGKRQRGQDDSSPTVAKGKTYWIRMVQAALDDLRNLRKLGAGAKADEIAKQFQARLRIPVKNKRRRTSRR